MTRTVRAAPRGRPRPGLPRGVPLLFCAAAISLAWAVGMVGCNRPAPPAPPPPPVVTVSTPLVREVVEWDEYIGRLESAEAVVVRPRVSGMILSVHFRDGQREPVQKDQLLFKIDPAPYQAELERATGEVVKSEAKVRYAAIEFANIEKVRTSGTGAVSDLEYETKRQAQTEAEGSLAAARATAAAAKLNVDYTDVKAPIAGRISRALITPGNLVTGGAGVGSQATLLTTIAGLDPIYCYVDADEASILKYQRLALEKKRVSARDADIPCYLNLANETDFPHEGTIDFVDNRLDPGTGTLQARGVFRNPGGVLIPGFFGRLRVPGSGRYEALLVPDAAVGTDQNEKYVLVVNGDTVDRRKVKLGGLFGTLRAIDEGITRADRVIVNGVQRARPGGKVQPQLAPIPPELFKPFAHGSPTTQALPQGREPATTQPTTALPAATAPTTGPSTVPMTPAAASATPVLAPATPATAPAAGGAQ